MKRKAVYTHFLLACLLASCAFLRSAGKCNVKKMLLGENDFPTGTIVNQISSPIAEMPYESAGFTANYSGSAMYHEIGRYPTDKIAEKEFEGAKKRASGQTEYVGPWEILPVLSRESSIFQKYYVACAAMNHGEYQCRMIGQYDEYYVFFSAYILDNGVTFDILNDLLQKIDARMEKCL